MNNTDTPDLRETIGRLSNMVGELGNLVAGHECDTILPPLPEPHRATIVRFPNKGHTTVWLAPENTEVRTNTEREEFGGRQRFGLTTRTLYDGNIEYPLQRFNGHHSVTYTHRGIRVVEVEEGTPAPTDVFGWHRLY